MNKKFVILFIILLSIYVMFVSYASSESYGTEVEYIGNSTEEYYVEVPAKLNPGERGQISLYGAWPVDKRVSIYADKTVTLTNKYNIFEKKTANVTFSGMDLFGSNTEEVSSLAYISVSDISDEVLFGTWSGKFNYNVEFNEVEMDGYNFYFPTSSHESLFSITYDEDKITLTANDSFYTYKGVSKEEYLNTFKNLNLELDYASDMFTVNNVLEVEKASDNVEFSFTYIGDGIYLFDSIFSGFGFIINKLPLVNEHVVFNQEYVMTYYNPEFGDFYLPYSYRVNNLGQLVYDYNGSQYSMVVGFVDFAVFNGNLVSYVDSENGIVSLYTTWSSNDLVAQWKLSSLVDSYVKFGQRYTPVYEADGYEDLFIDNVNFLFQYDGYVYVESPNGSINKSDSSERYVYSGSSISIVNSEDEGIIDIELKVSGDGKYIYFYDQGELVGKLQLVSSLNTNSNTSFKFGEKYYVSYINEQMLNSNSFTQDYLIINQDGSVGAYTFGEGLVESAPAGSFKVESDNGILFEEDGMKMRLYVFNNGNDLTFAIDGYDVIYMKLVSESSVLSKGSTVSYVTDRKYYDRSSSENAWVNFNNGEITIGYGTIVNGVDNSVTSMGPVKYKVVGNTVYAYDNRKIAFAFGQFSDDGKTFYLFDFLDNGRKLLSTYTIE